VLKKHNNRIEDSKDDNKKLVANGSSLKAHKKVIIE